MAPSFYGRRYNRRRIGLASAGALALVVLGLSLGLWQLRRAEEKAAMQSADDQAAAAPALELGAVAAGDGGAAAGLPPASAIAGARVQASGTFDAARSIFLDNRTREGVAGFHVLTPLKLAGASEPLIVLRGWIARDPADRSRLPALRTPPGPVRVEGLGLAELQQPMLLGEDPVPGPDDRLWQHFSVEKFARWSGTRPYPVIVRQTVEPDYQDGLARDWNRPGGAVDRHQAYAFQWFALTAAAILTWLILLWRSRGSRDVARDAG